MIVPTVGAFSIDWAGPDLSRAHENWATTQIVTAIEGAQLTGIVVIEGTTHAQPGYVVHSVILRLDKIDIGTAEGTDEWSFALDTALVMDGPHELTVAAMAHPASIPGLVSIGRGMKTSFVTSNYLPGVVLFEGTLDSSALAAGLWTHTLDGRYGAVRLTLEGEAADGAVVDGLPVAEAVLTYTDPDHASGTPSAPRQTWVAVLSPHGAHGSIARPPFAALAEGGTLTLGGSAQGEGTVTLRVEAMPAPDHL